MILVVKKSRIESKGVSDSFSQNGKKEELSDDELVINFQNGDKMAFDSLLKRYESRVISIAMSYTKNEQDTKDIYQETFIRVYKHLPKFEMRSQFSTWLHRIVINLCLTHLSPKRMMPMSFFSRTTDEGETEDYADTLVGGNNISSSYEARELISEAISRLSEKQRLIFVLKHIHGYKLTDIVEMTGATIGVVKKTLFVALAEVKKYIIKNA